MTCHFVADSRAFSGEKAPLSAEAGRVAAAMNGLKENMALLSGET
jgi:hypothetical protein